MKFGSEVRISSRKNAFLPNDLQRRILNVLWKKQNLGENVYSAASAKNIPVSVAAQMWFSSAGARVTREPVAR